MYLSRQIDWQGEVYKMTGALPADVVMHQRPQGRGYVRLQETGRAPWSIKSSEEEIAAHEFHHSSLVNIGDSIE